MNKFLKFLFVSQALNLLADNLLIPLFALFILRIGGSAQLAGILWGIQFATSALIGFFVLRLRDKGNLNYSLVRINYLVKALAWAILIFNQSIAAMVVVQILIGFASAVGGPAFEALASEHLDKNHHIKDWATLQLTANIVVAISSVISGIIMVQFGFTIIFAIMSLLEFISLLIIYLHKPSVKINY